MNFNKKHVYFVPGLAAGKKIFNNIRLPQEYEIHILEWLIPKKKEALNEYAKRMALCIEEKNPILIGVSFGGVVAQEMSAFLTVEKLIIISSAKSRSELPKKMKFASFTKIYKLIPTGLVLSAKDLTKFSIGPKSKKRLGLYQQYLQVRDRQYLDWALEKMVTWNRNQVNKKVYHLHGDKDLVFPIKYISNCMVIEGGTHIMIINKGREISKKILEIIKE